MSILPPQDAVRECLVTCRAGLEDVLADELRGLGINQIRKGRRCVYFETDLAGVYRCNMGLQTAIQVLQPLRTFNARNYDMLYYQSRKTNWHKLFDVGCNLRIDVNGHSPVMRNTQYVVHRIKDGIVDTFRKLSDGKRPSIDKREPDIHIVAHLDGNRVTICLGTSGVPLFKRGYREKHGVAPLKEDLAAGILRLCGWNGDTPLLDPVCGSGTFLFEAWMLATGTPPNADRRFAFESLFDYDASLHEKERRALLERVRPSAKGVRLAGIESDESTVSLAREIHRNYFPEAAIDWHEGDFRKVRIDDSDTTVIANPPYGRRLESSEASDRLHHDLVEKWGEGCLHIFTGNSDVVKKLRPKPHRNLTLFNGAIEARLLSFGRQPVTVAENEP